MSDAADKSALGGEGRNPIQDAIASDLRSLELDASDGFVAPLAAYLTMLQKWNAAYNLTAVRTPDAMRVQHLADCLAVIPALRSYAAERQILLSRQVDGDHPMATGQLLTDGSLPSCAFRVLDVGSGGGLPGVVLAVMQPDWQVHCIDAVAKKAAFIRQVGGELRLSNLHAMHGRVEQLHDAHGFDLIVSRAFASLRDFVLWTRNAMAPNGVWVAMKGRDAEAEVGDEPVRGVRVTSIEKIHPPGMDAARCLVWIAKK